LLLTRLPRALRDFYAPGLLKGGGRISIFNTASTDRFGGGPTALSLIGVPYLKYPALGRDVLDLGPGDRAFFFFFR